MATPAWHRTIVGGLCALGLGLAGCGSVVDREGSGIPGRCTSIAPVLEPLRTDILFVIDNSSSMQEEQEGIARELPDVRRRAAGRRGPHPGLPGGGDHHLGLRERAGRRRAHVPRLRDPGAGRAAASRAGLRRNPRRERPPLAGRDGSRAARALPAAGAAGNRRQRPGDPLRGRPPRGDRAPRLHVACRAGKRGLPAGRRAAAGGGGQRRGRLQRAGPPAPGHRGHRRDPRLLQRAGAEAHLHRGLRGRAARARRRDGRAADGPLGLHRARGPGGQAGGGGAGGGTAAQCGLPHQSRSGPAPAGDGRGLQSRPAQPGLHLPGVLPAEPDRHRGHRQREPDPGGEQPAGSRSSSRWRSPAATGRWRPAPWPMGASPIPPRCARERRGASTSARTARGGPTTGRWS